MIAKDIPTAQLGLGLIKYQRGRYLLNVLTWASIWVMPMIPALITKAFFDRITGEATAGFNVPTLVMFVVVYAVGRIAVMFLGMWNDAHLMFRIGTLMRRNMLERIFELPGAQSMKESPGEAISRFRDDVDENVESFSWTVDMIGLFVFSGLAVWILVGIDGTLTALVFGPSVAVVYLAAIARHRIRRYREASRHATGRITEALGETFGSVQAIKVAGAEPSMIAHFRMLNDRRRVAAIKDKVLTAMLESLFWNTINVGTGIILIVAAGAMRTGEFTVGEFAVFVYFLGFVTDAGFFLGLFIARYQQASVSFGRMVELMGDAPPMRLVKPISLHLTGDLEAPDVVPPHLAPLEVLEVRDLTFHYPDTDDGIEDVSFAVPAGSFTVITGRVGAGKTTLLRAILGLVEPQRGDVLWNDEVVEQPAEFFIPPRSAYTPQVPRLFSMTLMENLLMGRRDPETEVKDAVASAVMEPDVENMPEGLATLVGPMGVRLSGGQIQRSATARMFVRRPDLLVFDDVSSALDVETERVLWERLFRERSGVTSLVVSHRHPALQRANQIVVMHQGRVAAIGRLNDLLATSPEFRALWEGEEG
ncbi:MAG: ABC transporter ATP-binding protein [Actinomycetota bacterium]|jgi:ATP-binding cassette subfamily B protein|nr:ABC transporter ATP-binding protein [Actinomycetota bacterium]